MKKKSIIIFGLIIFSFNYSFSQNSLFVPLNYLNAVDKGTRSLNGMPGESYWQNSSDYYIKVKIDPFERLLEGKELITYYNNSPDTLNQIYFRLYQNIHKANAPRDGLFNKEWLSEGMTISSLKVNGESYDLNDRKLINEAVTNLQVVLKEKLPPASSIAFEIEWHFEIPKNSWRMGYFDSTSAFIAYWYPQISVYDDIDGWDVNEYKGYAEMYNDFNNYEVEITVPKDFGLWATGMLQNPEQILNQKFLDRYNTALKSDEVTNIITKEDLESGSIYQLRDELTYKFSAIYVPDFAFGFSDHYLWDAVNLKLNNGNDVYIAAAYKEQSEDFYQVTQIAKDCLIYFSEEIPGIPYPYPSAVVFNGSGGMEFPMIVNDGSASSIASTVGLTAHELAHQYMPFYMGTNERKYAWMDEGWAVMFPVDFQERYNHQRRIATVKAYEDMAGTEKDIPPVVLSVHLTGPSYRNAAYNRPGIAYIFLRDFMGDEIFKSALHEFIHRWNGKHPLPYDFFNTFNEVAGEDLSWFWKPWFFDYGYPDTAIKDVYKQESKLFVTIQKIGNVPVPVHLNFVYEADWEKIVYKSADVWKDGRDELVIEYETEGNVIKIELGNDSIPYTDKRNNIYLIHAPVQSN